MTNLRPGSRLHHTIDRPVNRDKSDLLIKHSLDRDDLHKQHQLHTSQVVESAGHKPSDVRTALMPNNQQSLKEGLVPLHCM
jgi:hypothetical protein